MTPLDRVRRYVAAASLRPGAVVNNSADLRLVTVDDLRAVLALVPAEVSEVIPEPAVGQVWSAPGMPGAFTRKITDVRVRADGVIKQFVWRRVLSDGSLGAEQWSNPSSFRAWVRHSGARPVTP